jgi:hypothetical protein
LGYFLAKLTHYSSSLLISCELIYIINLFKSH